MVHTRLEENHRKLQMDFVFAKISTPKDSDGKNALKP